MKPGYLSFGTTISRLVNNLIRIDKKLENMDKGLAAIKYYYFVLAPKALFLPLSWTRCCRSQPLVVLIIYVKCTYLQSEWPYFSYTTCPGL